jgi:hypothetical protein
MASSKPTTNAAWLLIANRLMSFEFIVANAA